ncbi:Gfo/Idh/MocA family oxidoreductase [Saccharopolyspora indica]|uniref:Gfo/Idh/MocA family protein n=1 Tax=Saccharopolyspora indica TaxID=1229659 RepID=UPI0022EB03BD|nr:Gfo/Idh/MocA family oxidoreductase [Saccharopolyspora indica]MDA3642937.1 Gfo/Idh/MocA family oxidoreductase [Saccharopolyspora indica]
MPSSALRAAHPDPTRNPADQVQVCIVGGSSAVAPRHVEAATDHPATSVGALVEPDETKAERLRQRYPAIPVVDRALAAPRGGAGLAIVCAPDAVHAEVVTRCLDLGWHVLCEKPLTDDAEAAARLYDHAERAGRYLGVAYQRRFMVEGLLGWIGDGITGRLHCINARWLRRAGHPESRRSLARRGHGVRGDLIPHLLSQALPLLGPEPLTVQARDWQVGPGWSTEDVARLTIRSADQVELQIDAAYDAPHLDKSDDCWLEIHGTRGSVHAELPTHQDEQWAAAHPPTCYPRTGDPVALPPLRTTAQCHLLQLDHVVRALASGPAPVEERERELALVRAMAASQASATWQGPIIPV